MTPQEATNKKRIIYGLIVLGFAGLIGAHEFAVTPPEPGGDASMTVPFILAMVGTLAFVVAGIMAYRLMRGGASR
jgi:hypothetical protein